jgi:hypothetical protein
MGPADGRVGMVAGTGQWSVASDNLPLAFARVNSEKRDRALPCAGGLVARQNGPVARSTQTNSECSQTDSTPAHSGNYF